MFQSGLSAVICVCAKSGAPQMAGSGKISPYCRLLSWVLPLNELLKDSETFPSHGRADVKE